MFWNSSFLSLVTMMIAQNLGKFQYEIESVWFDAQITSSSMVGNTNVYSVSIASSADGLITGIRFLDKYGNVAGQRKENIIKRSGNSIILKCRIYADEKEAT